MNDGDNVRRVDKVARGDSYMFQKTWLVPQDFFTLTVRARWPYETFFVDFYVAYIGKIGRVQPCLQTTYI